MLHLAQVQIKKPQDRAELLLLARQQSEYAWKILPEQTPLPFDNAAQFGNQSLVLVTLSDLGDVLTVESANAWLLSIIQTFLRNGITPTFLQQEAERAEQWRQTLTLQNQDLDRRALELEARREQIEQLEDSLKRDKKQVESLAAQYKEQSQELDQRTMELQARQEQLERLEESLRRDKEQLEALLAQQQIKLNPSN